MPQRTAPLAKLSSPRLYAPIQRARLFTILDRASGHPLTWICAPAGAGKSTLVASYLRSRDIHRFHRCHLWLRLDEADKDPANLFLYLSELARQGATSRKQRALSLPLFTAEAHADLPGFARGFFRQFFRITPARTILVLDDCQDAEGNAFPIILKAICDEVPVDGRVIALSRTPLPSPLARQRTNGEVVILDGRELRLDDDEARRLVQTVAPARMDDVANLNRLCHGWLGGMILLLAQGAIVASARDLRHDHALFDYLHQETFERAPLRTRNLLLRTAMLPYITPPMACELTGDPRAADVLDELFRQQFFIERHGPRNDQYRYHDLFRQFLLTVFRRVLSRREADALRARTAAILEREYLTDEAIALRKEARQWSDAFRLILQNAERYIEQGRLRTVANWFVQLPRTLVHKDPWALLWLGVVTLAQDPKLSERHLERARRLFAHARNRQGQLTAIIHLSDLPFLTEQSFRRLRKYRGVLTDYLSTRRAVDNPYYCRAHFSISLFLGYRAEHLDRVVGAMERALRHGSMRERMDSASLLVHYALWYDRPDVGARIATRFEISLGEDEVPTLTAYFVRKDLGYWYLFTGNPALAKPHFELAAQSARRLGIDVQVVVAQSYLALTHIALGEVAAAQAALRDAVAHVSADATLASAYMNWASSLLCAAKGDLRAAYDWAEGCRQRAASIGFALLEILAIALTSSIAFRRGEWSVVDARLKALRARLEVSGMTHLSALMHAMATGLALHRGDLASASSAMRSCLLHADCAAGGYFLDWARDALPSLLAFALEHAIEPQRAAALITKLKLKAPDVGVASWPWPVRIYVLDGFRLIAGQRTLRPGRKSKHKLMEALKYLSTRGPGGVDAQTAADVLWPESEGDVALSNLRTVITRLRRLLDHDEALLFVDGRVRLNVECCWVDAWAFDASVEAAHAPKAAEGANSHRLSEALALYRSHLLAQDHAHWVIGPRERIKTRFRMAVARMAELHQLARAAEAQFALYRAAVDIDPAAESIAIAFMQMLHDRADFSRGRAVFTRLVDALSAESSHRASARARDLYRSMGGA